MPDVVHLAGRRGLVAAAELIATLDHSSDFVRTHANRARQQHGQAVTLALGVPIAGNCYSDRAGAPRIVQADPSSVQGRACGASLAVQAQTLDSGDLYRPSGPDDEGQARGQA